MAKQHLVENFRVPTKSVKKITLTETTKTITEGEATYKCRGAYSFPVWRLDKVNLNERIYGSNLAEQVVKESKVTTGLMNHPKEDVDVEKTFCVERNPRVKDGILWIDSYLVGDSGQLVNEIIEAGGEIGLSSSAYGDVDDSGNVMTEGFEVERYADFVDSPSYEVFANSEMALQSDDKEIEGSIQATTKINNEDIKDTSTNTIDENVKENTMRDNVSDEKLSLEEKNMKIGAETLFREAERADTPKGKLSFYNKIIEYCDGEKFAVSYTEEANKKIDEINNELHELAGKAKGQDDEINSLKENQEVSKKEQESIKEKSDSLQTDLESITEKYEISTDLLDRLKEREVKLKELYSIALAEKNGMVSASEYRELQLYSENLEKTLSETKLLVLKLKQENRKGSIGKKVLDTIKKDSENLNTEDVDTTIDESESKDDNEYKFEVDNIDVQLYYEDRVAVDPNFSKIKDEILGCRTIFEAQKLALDRKGVIEENESPYLMHNRQIEESVEEKRSVSSPDISKMLHKGWS